MRMPTCPNCASAVRPGLRYCTRCGTRLHSARSVTPSGPPAEQTAVSVVPVVPAVPVYASASASAARPTILDLALAAEPVPVPEAVPQPVPQPQPQPEPRLPFGVPIISAQRPLGPGADPTDIGRSRSNSPPTSSPAVPSPGSPPRGGSADEITSDPPRHAPKGRVPSRRLTPPPKRSAAATWSFVTGTLPLIISVAGNALAARLGLDAVAATESGVTTGAWAPVFVTLAVVFVANGALLTVCAIMGGRGIRETGNGVTKGRGLAVAGLALGGVNLVLWITGLVITVGGFSSVLA